ncbi:histidinol-phosphatase [Halorubrum ezzemoulense]|jgi:predicted metal-dependent phosphoesterase TrpH|uniref:Histidinol-phosphatase n=1 Tax=Halorubrum ezzemoulense TaxID=337243 RepID=A0A238X5A2_HALEZ|nr:MULTISPECIES: PHP domain-containing protein [Halorubrum]MDB2261220.1 PHP domain-containing protein [Halorubrum ezzemoulense]MDB2268292.1 PHP domain-containing protein [Halorubrum ezzemoulense]MDB2274174.1 PHP domain-containing protein [Halorubrum ezzemoulense]OYR56952.1 histidinol-phosphatase [Halorubrum ezzemoulense]TKX35001.1 PHP domain-containing protein [Halorubrum sp. CGM5_25_10-8B]
MPAASDDRVVADLHAHTTLSDGTMTLDEVPAAAREAGVDWVAVTDHDSVHPEIDAPVVERDGVRIVRGIELRVDAGFGRLDLLGYGVEHTGALDAEIDRLQRDRRERGAAILDAVEERLGVDLDIEPRAGLGRPHIARAIDESEAPYDYAGAFDELIGNDGPCYVARDVTPLDEGLDLLDDACALVGLAHPFRYERVDEALDVARESAAIDAVERFYPYGRAVDDSRIDRLAAEADLLRTGGTDAHERTLGVAGLTASAFEPVRDRLPEAVPTDGSATGDSAAAATPDEQD